MDSLRQASHGPALAHSQTCPFKRLFTRFSVPKINFELNVVLTQFNAGEIADIVKLCDDHRISAKFFEHIQSSRADSTKGSRIFEPKPLVAFEEFEAIVSSTLPGVAFRNSRDFGEANSIFEREGYSIRYCRYLCPFGLCRRTGTRIDPNGFVYTCMEKDGHLKISPVEPLITSMATIAAANAEGCNFTTHALLPA